MKLAWLLLAWSVSTLAQDNVVPKVLVTEIQPGFKPAHALQLDGDTLVYTIQFGAETQRKEIKPTRSQWSAFRRALDRDKVWRWQGSYKQNATDSMRWQVKIEYPDRSVAASGYGAFPDRDSDHALPKYPFTRYRLALEALLGQPFERPVKAMEVFDIGELKLVGTHVSANEAERWADFRDPAGKLHRAAIREPVGALGVLQKVNRSSVEVSVLERTQVLKLSSRKPR
jgi:hypothetical protein